MRVTNIINLFRSEWSKLISRAKYWVLAALVLLGCLVSAFLYGILSERTGVTFDASQYPMLLLPMLAKFVLPLAIFMGVADLMPSELSDASIRALLVRPLTRVEIYIGKCSAVFCYVAAMLAGSYAVAGGISFLLEGGARVSVLLSGLLAYIVTLAPMLVMILVAMLIGVGAKSPTLTMLICILGYVALLVLPSLFPYTGIVLFTNYLGWYNMWMGDAMNWMQRLSVLGLFASTGLLALLAGLAVFEKKES